LLPERLGVEEAEGELLRLRRELPVPTGVPEAAGLADSAVEGVTDPVKVWALKVPCEELVRDCVEVAEREGEPVGLRGGLPLPTELPEELWLTETEREGEPLPVMVFPLKDPTGEPLEE